MTDDKVIKIKRREGVSDIFGVPLEDLESKPREAKGGRPKGSKTATDIPRVEVTLTRCPDCQSTERTEYFNRTEHAISGVDDSGAPYTHVVWRSTNCQNCGQLRRDVTRENRIVPE